MKIARKLPIVLLLTVLGAPSLAIGETLSDIEWIAGHWKGAWGGGTAEEIWSPRDGDSMMGMWRWVADGQIRLFEFLTLRETDGAVAMFLRHFDKAGIGWEEKDQPVELALVTNEPKKAVFFGDGEKGELRIVYELKAPERLDIAVTHGDEFILFELEKQAP